MPSRIRRRRSRDRLDVLTFDQVFDLRAGPYEHRAAFADDAERRQAWERHRDELIELVAADRFATGKRPEAFWQYDIARPELLRDRDRGAEEWDPDVEYSFDADMALLQARTAYLAEHDLLEPHELANIRHPSPRSDGNQHEWDVAGLAGLDEGLARRNERKGATA